MSKVDYQPMKTAFADYFRGLIGEVEAEQFFSSIDEKEKRRALRVNTLKTSKADLKKWLKSQGYKVSDSPFSPDGVEIEGKGEPLSLKLPYHAGFTYPQDPSSMFAVELLDPQPGETCIDLTAAPGGKATHIAQKMENTGVLIANDHDLKRLKALHYNLERLGIWNTLVTRMTPYKLSLNYTEVFDRVLLDPSCSGEGLLVTYDGKPKHWSPKSLKRYATEQFGLLCSAFRLLKPGGRLVYSTCTLNAVEDDGVVEKLLAKFPEAKIEKVKVDGEPEQIGDLKGIRFWPHKTQTKGFFCIAITKTASLEFEDEEPASGKFVWLNKRKAIPHLKYLKKHFDVELEDVYLTQKEGNIFRISAELARFPLPTRYSLSFPLLKRDKGETSLAHAGALWLVGLAKKNVGELKEEELEEFFEGKLKKDEVLLKYEDFPLGLANLPKYF